MKLFRYRKPSLNNILGITKIKRSVKKATGISTVERFTNPNRIKQTVKQKIGIYGSPRVTAVRQTIKGKIPNPVGIFSKIKFW
jgi:hypothetical protein